MTVIYVLGGVVVVFYHLWVGYLALTNLDRARAAGSLTPAARVACAPLLLYFGILDVLVNWVLGTLLFLDVPREFTLSQRCSRHYRKPGWRGRVSRWLGHNALNPFDRTGDHLD
jgi:hypothetical protein